MKFGDTASDYKEDQDANADEVWVRYFKDAETKFRFMPFEARNRKGQMVQGCDAYPTEREHFHPKIGSFPCVKDKGATCHGCEDSNERVRNRSRKYYFPAIDSEGLVRIFKMGPKLFQRFQAREARAGTLIDRDFFVLKTGSGLNTEYEIEPGEKYEIDFESDYGDQEVPDIPHILEGRYEAMVDFYTKAPDVDPDEPAEGHEDVRETGRKLGSGRGEAEPEEAPKTSGRLPTKKAASKPDPEPEPEEEPAPAPRKAAAKKTATRKPAPEPEPEPEEEPADDGNAVVFTTKEDIIDASTAELKDYLDQADVEYPARAPRERLIKMVHETSGIAPF